MNRVLTFTLAHPVTVSVPVVNAVMNHATSKIANGHAQGNTTAQRGRDDQSQWLSMMLSMQAMKGFQVMKHKPVHGVFDQAPQQQTRRPCQSDRPVQCGRHVVLQQVWLQQYRHQIDRKICAIGQLGMLNNDGFRGRPRQAMPAFSQYLLYFPDACRYSCMVP